MDSFLMLRNKASIPLPKDYASSFKELVQKCKEIYLSNLIKTRGSELEGNQQFEVSVSINEDLQSLTFTAITTSHDGKSMEIGEYAEIKSESGSG